MILSTSLAWMVAQPLAEGGVLALTSNPRDLVPAIKEVWDIYHGDPQVRKSLAETTMPSPEPPRRELTRVRFTAD